MQLSNIPKARLVIKSIAQELEDAGDVARAAILRSAEVLLRRRSAARRAPSHSNPVTPAAKAQIIELAETTDLHSSEIAAQVGVNPGRVSEILQGDR